VVPAVEDRLPLSDLSEVIAQAKVIGAVPPVAAAVSDRTSETDVMVVLVGEIVTPLHFKLEVTVKLAAQAAVVVGSDAWGVI